jgi:hydroxymethylbilane synthase
VRGLVQPVYDQDAALALTHERLLVDKLRGGCATPIGALLKVSGDRVTLTAVVASPSGEKAVRAAHAGRRAEAGAVVDRVLEELLAGGAAEIIDACRQSPNG